MSDYSELRDIVRRAVDGGSLMPLREWIESYDAPISESGDPSFQELISDVWAIFSESDLGESNDDGMRRRLADALVEAERFGKADTSVTANLIALGMRDAFTVWPRPGIPMAIGGTTHFGKRAAVAPAHSVATPGLKIVVTGAPPAVAIR